MMPITYKQIVKLKEYKIYSLNLLQVLIFCDIPRRFSELEEIGIIRRTAEQMIRRYPDLLYRKFKREEEVNPWAPKTVLIIRSKRATEILQDVFRSNKTGAEK